MRDSMNVTRRDAIKLGAGTMAAAAAVSLAACGGSSSSDSDSSASSSEQKSSYKVAIVISGPALDGRLGPGPLRVPEEGLRGPLQVGDA